MESAGINSGGGWVRGEITRGIVETERSGRQHGVWCRDRQEHGSLFCQVYDMSRRSRRRRRTGSKRREGGLPASGVVTFFPGLSPLGWSLETLHRTAKTNHLRADPDRLYAAALRMRPACRTPIEA